MKPKAEQTQNTLQQAETLCSQQGGRLTYKRKRILDLMLHTDRPLSAYQISDLYSEQHNSRLSIMSVYRMLNFLKEVNLVHRLETTNQYIACSHIDTSHRHETNHLTPQFLICDQCKRVDETGLREDILQQLNHDLERSGFTMQQKQLEIHGTCSKCSEKTKKQLKNLNLPE